MHRAANPKKKLQYDFENRFFEVGFSPVGFSKDPNSIFLSEWTSMLFVFYLAIFG